MDRARHQCSIRSAPALSLVVLGSAHLDGSEEIDDTGLLATLDVLAERLVQGVLHGELATEAEGLCQEIVIDGEPRWHKRMLTRVRERSNVSRRRCALAAIGPESGGQ